MADIVNAIPRPEHPRPQFMRADKWLNLNGKWDFLLDFGVSGMERELWKSENFTADNPIDINVPFCPESRLSGIALTDFIPAVWYRRTFTLTAEQISGRTILHFGAVDYESDMWINGVHAGYHKGGYSSFEFDITSLVKEGENEIIVYAKDNVRSGEQPCGKQSTLYYSHACSYTRTTGIWQTVWLEFVPKAYIKYAKITPFINESNVRIDAEVIGDGIVSAEAYYGGKKVGAGSGKAVYGNAEIVITIDELHLWAPGAPELYDLTLSFGEDKVESYFGMRSVELTEDALAINGKKVFMRTILDQGFNPEGVYTAPSDEFLKEEIERSMALGFNGARLHQRVFEERTLYWADHLGYIVWGEYANGSRCNDGCGIGFFLPEWMEVVRRDYSHPAIIGWCPENESYWAHDIDGICQRTYYAVTKQMDPYRPVIDASGGLHFITDMFDIHDYDQNPVTFKENLWKMVNNPGYLHNPLHNNVLARHVYGGQPYWISEYGGTWWNPDASDGWGYGTLPKSEDEFAARYEGLTSALLGCPKVCGFCYTQLTDVEQEQNGLYKYDRSPKFSPEVYARIRQANMQIAEIEK